MHLHTEWEQNTDWSSYQPAHEDNGPQNHQEVRKIYKVQSFKLK